MSDYVTKAQVEEIRERSGCVRPDLAQRGREEYGDEDAYATESLLSDVEILLAWIDRLETKLKANLAQREQRIEDLGWEVFGWHEGGCWSGGTPVKPMRLHSEPCPVCRAYYARIHGEENNDDA